MVVPWNCSMGSGKAEKSKDEAAGPELQSLYCASRSGWPQTSFSGQMSSSCEAST
jgi:hypothetical protein